MEDKSTDMHKNKEWLAPSLLIIILLFGLGLILYRVLKGSPMPLATEIVSLDNTQVFTELPIKLDSESSTPTTLSTSKPKSTPTTIFTSTPETIPTVTEDYIATSTVSALETSTSIAHLQATATMQACIHETDIAPPDWEIKLCDEFITGTNWPVGEDNSMGATLYRSISNGNYRWEITNDLDHSNSFSRSIPGNSFSDFYATFIAQHISGTENDKYGLVFRNDGENLYALEVRDTGFYRLRSRYGGEEERFETLLDWMKSPNFRPGEKNRLSLLVDGPQLTIFINDQFAGEISDNQWQSGSIGLLVGIEGETGVFEFDQFELRTP